MGNGSSIEANKTIYVEINGRNERIVFSRQCSSQDIVELLVQAAGGIRSGVITLRDSEGALIAMSPTMPTNAVSNPYKLTWKELKRPQDRTSQNSQMMQSVLSQVSDHFNSAFKVEELQTQLNERLRMLERKMEIESLKLVEIEKCKKDIADIRDHFYNNLQKRTMTTIDFRMSCSSFSDEEKMRLKPRREMLTFEKYTLSEETVNYLKQPTFDIWHWEANEMLCLLEHMYHELGLVREFSINPITLKRWLLCVQENYRNNPFHNFRHCFCVTQMMYGLLHLCGLQGKLAPEDVCILITGCVCHDLDHPGYNNTYQINARTELAIRYNDISPLENHHCAVAFQILSNPETNIFANVDQSTFKRIRSGMVMLILATDMARHNEILEAFRSKCDIFDFSSDDHLNSLKMVLIKCCDISNEVRPFEVSEPWVDCLLEEYFNQSDREKEEGLPVAPFMDREKVTKPTAQIGFIKFVLIPMFDTVAKLFPQLYDVIVKPLIDARDRYEVMKESDEKKGQQKHDGNKGTSKHQPAEPETKC